MDQFTRRITGFGVHAGDVNGVILCRLFNASISTQNIPHYLSSDNDPIFRYNRWQANLWIPGINEIKSIPAVVSGDSRIQRAELSDYSWISHCNGLFQTPIAA
jgi:hypothetical protein